VSRSNLVRLGGIGGALYITINALNVLFMRALASDWAARGFLGFLILPLLSVPAFFGWTWVPWALFWLLLALQGLCWMLLGGMLWFQASRRETRAAQSAPA
jgi:hypothetical protein